MAHASNLPLYNNALTPAQKDLLTVGFVQTLFGLEESYKVELKAGKNQNVFTLQILQSDF